MVSGAELWAGKFLVLRGVDLGDGKLPSGTVIDRPPNAPVLVRRRIVTPYGENAPLYDPTDRLLVRLAREALDRANSSADEPEPEPESYDLGGRTKKDLIALAGSRGINVSGRWTKQRILDALQEADG